METVAKISTKSGSRILLPEDYKPSSYDVICAKGKFSFNHEGNKRFRALIDGTSSKYHTCSTKQRKTAIVMEVVEQVRGKNACGGGFIRKDRMTGLWYEIGEDAAREKVGQSLREAIVRADPVKTARKKHLRAIRRGKAQRTTFTGELPVSAEKPFLVSSPAALPSRLSTSLPLMPSHITVPNLNTSGLLGNDLEKDLLFDDLPALDELNWISESESSDMGEDNLFDLDQVFEMDHEPPVPQPSICISN